MYCAILAIETINLKLIKSTVQSYRLSNFSSSFSEPILMSEKKNLASSLGHFEILMMSRNCSEFKSIMLQYCNVFRPIDR